MLIILKSENEKAEILEQECLRLQAGCSWHGCLKSPIGRVPAGSRISGFVQNSGEVPKSSRICPEILEVSEISWDSGKGRIHYSGLQSNFKNIETWEDKTFMPFKFPLPASCSLRQELKPFGHTRKQTNKYFDNKLISILYFSNVNTLFNLCLDNKNVSFIFKLIHGP